MTLLSNTSHIMTAIKGVVERGGAGEGSRELISITIMSSVDAKRVHTPHTH